MLVINQAQPPIFGPCLLWPNGWMDQDATLYRGRPQPKRHCVTWGPSCLEGKRENYQVCSVQYCVQQLCTVQCTHVWTDLTVLWIGICLTGPISLCLDSFLCMYVFSVWLYIACMCSYCNMVRWTWWDWSLSWGLLLPSVLWHCWLGHL